MTGQTHQIVNAFKSQNDLICESDTIKLIKKYLSGKDKSSMSIIIEVDSRLHKKILDKSSVIVGWNSCHVFDATQVTRCYKCSRLGHLANDCENIIFVALNAHVVIASRTAIVKLWSVLIVVMQMWNLNLN